MLNACASPDIRRNKSLSPGTLNLFTAHSCSYFINTALYLIINIYTFNACIYNGTQNRFDNVHKATYKMHLYVEYIIFISSCVYTRENNGTQTEFLWTYYIR